MNFYDKERDVEQLINIVTAIPFKKKNIVTATLEVLGGAEKAKIQRLLIGGPFLPIGMHA